MPQARFQQAVNVATRPLTRVKIGNTVRSDSYLHLLTRYIWRTSTLLFSQDERHHGEVFLRSVHEPELKCPATAGPAQPLDRARVLLVQLARQCLMVIGILS